MSHLLRSAMLLVCASGMAAAQSAQLSSLQGRVVRWGSVEPIGRATVELRSVDTATAAPYIVRTLADGSFSFLDIPSGRYRIVVTKAGYVTAEYGQRWPNGAGALLTMPPGQSVSNVPIPMLPTGAISGTVRDALGQPIGNAEVEAFKATYRTGRRVLTRVQSVQSDDRGEYRLFWLTPGKYFVAAKHPDLSQSPMRAGSIRVGGGGPNNRFQEFRSSGDNASAAPFDILGRQTIGKEKYMVVYYPNTTDEMSAISIEVAPGADVEAIDFTVAQIPLQRVRGRVVYEANNEPAMSAQVQWVTATGASPGDSETILGPMPGAATVQCCDGAFELGLPAGSYAIVAAVNSQNARTAVTVGDSDVDGVVVALARGFNIPGRVVFEGRAPTAAELSALRISLAMDPPVNGLAPDSYSNVLANGSFMLAAGRGDFRVSIQPVLPVPGAFRFGLSNPPASLNDVYVKSIRLGDVDVLDRGLHLDTPPQQPLEIVISSATGALEGRVLNAGRQPVPGVPVLLVPDRPRRFRMDLMRSTSSDASGRFRIDRLPPGDYVALAIDGVDDGEWQNPDFIATHEAQGALVRIASGGSASADLVALSP